MKYLFFLTIFLGCVGQPTDSSQAETTATETTPTEQLGNTVADQPSTDEYLKSTLQEAKYLLNSEDPRIWRRAMMSH